LYDFGYFRQGMCRLIAIFAVDESVFSNADIALGICVLGECIELPSVDRSVGQVSQVLPLLEGGEREIAAEEQQR
jgi:hypothetical protein